MAKNVDVELDDFLRWLATMPQHRAEYRKDPENVMDYAMLSDMAKSALREIGAEQVVERAKEKLDEILNSPESKKESTFSRDFSASGYGGKVVKKEPVDPE